MTDNPKPNQEHPDEPPPFLGSWSRVYVVVLLYLVVLIFLFYLFGATFTP